MIVQCFDIIRSPLPPHSGQFPLLLILRFTRGKMIVKYQFSCYSFLFIEFCNVLYTMCCEKICSTFIHFPSTKFLFIYLIIICYYSLLCFILERNTYVDKFGKNRITSNRMKCAFFAFILTNKRRIVSL